MLVSILFSILAAGQSLSPTGLPRFVLASLLLAFANSAHAEPALWKVERPGQTLYLFGTMHALPAGETWLDGRIEHALQRSEVLVLESEPTAEVEQSLQALAMSLGTYADGTGSLQSAVGAARWEALRDFAGSVGLPEPALQSMRPWLANLTINVVAVSALGLDPRNGVDRMLNSLASERAMPVEVIEDADAMLRRLAALDESAQLGMLDMLLRNLPQYRELVDSIHTAWREGDIEAIDRRMNDDLREVAALHGTLLVERNRAWAERLLGYQGRQPTRFVAVGAGHLVGPDGLPALLEAAGAKVERVTRTTTAATAHNTHTMAEEDQR